MAALFCETFGFSRYDVILKARRHTRNQSLLIDTYLLEEQSSKFHPSLTR